MNFRVDTMITFLNSSDLEKTHAFYHDFLGFSLAMDQGKCRIYETPYGNVGFYLHCEAYRHAGLVCLIMDNREDIDEIYEKLCKNNQELGICIESKPIYNYELAVYQFYLSDPSGNKLEFRCFE